MKLENRVVIIAGANSGVGKATAKRFSEAGAKVVLVGRSVPRLEGIAKEAGLEAGRWIGVDTDLTKEDGAQMVIKEALDKFGKADILINFVGGWLGGEPVWKLLQKNGDDDSKSYLVLIFLTKFSVNIF